MSHRSLCAEWAKHPYENPETNHAIKRKKKTFNRLYDECSKLGIYPTGYTEKKQLKEYKKEQDKKELVIVGVNCQTDKNCADIKTQINLLVENINAIIKKINDYDPNKTNLDYDINDLVTDVILCFQIRISWRFLLNQEYKEKAILMKKEEQIRKSLFECLDFVIKELKRLERIGCTKIMENMKKNWEEMFKIEQ